MSTPQAVFGPGIVVVTRTDIAGVPINIGYAQEFSLDFSGTTKNLFGQNQYPLVSARGTVKVTGKVKAAVLSGIAWNNTFFGNSFTVGGSNYYSEVDSVPGTGPYTITVAHVTGGIIDLGVVYSGSGGTGLPLQRVSSVTAAGQYSVVATTGVYTFFSGDSAAQVTIRYSNVQSTAGQQLNVSNQPIGYTPTFTLDYWNNLNQPNPKPFSAHVHACVASKLALAGKLEDYIMPEFDFDVFADNAGNVIDFNFAEVS